MLHTIYFIVYSHILNLRRIMIMNYLWPSFLVTDFILIFKMNYEFVFSRKFPFQTPSIGCHIFLWRVQRNLSLIERTVKWEKKTLIEFLFINNKLFWSQVFLDPYVMIAFCQSFKLTFISTKIGNCKQRPF